MQTILWFTSANIATSMATNAPVADVGERLLVGDVVNKKNAHGAAVVSGGDSSKPFLMAVLANTLQNKRMNVVLANILQNKRMNARMTFYLAGGVPNLQLAALVVDFDSANLEIDADGGDERSVESVIREAEQQAALAYTGVSY